MRICYYSVMNFDQLEYFLSVAETEHMTKSAQRLGIAQPALSRSISRLENEWGVKLFEREGRGLALTREGKLAQQGVKRVLEDMRELEQTLASSRKEGEREVRIHLAAASHIAADAMASWMADNPTTKLSLTQTSPEHDVSADITIDSHAPLRYGRYARFEERIMIAVPDGLELGADPLPFAKLSHLDFVSLSSKSGFTQFTDELCEKAGFEPHIAFESDNPSVVRKMIGLGLGVGFWPEHSWGPLKGKGVKLLPLETKARRCVWIWTSPDASPTTEDFFDHLKGHFESCFS